MVIEFPHRDLGLLWAGRRPSGLTYMDNVSAGRASKAVIRTQAAYLRREALLGAFLAEGEAEAQGLLNDVTEGVAALLGAEGSEVALLDSATRAYGELISGWHLPRGALVGYIPSEFPSNLMALGAKAKREDLCLIRLNTDEYGRLDLDDLESYLARGLALVTLPHVASHRGIVQPVGVASAACARYGVPMIVDAAQALGQVPTALPGRGAVVGHARNWLAGPRGVGFIAVTSDLASELTPPLPNIGTHDWSSGDVTAHQGAGRLHAEEGSIAARLGLGTALREFIEAQPSAIFERLSAQGRAIRQALSELPGWSLGEPVDEPSALVTLKATDGRDASEVRQCLWDMRIVVSVVGPTRSPGDIRTPILRIAPHVDITEGDVAALRAALERAS